MGARAGKGPGPVYLTLEKLAAGDEELRFTIGNGRVLVTLDGDFANVIRFPRTSPTEEAIRGAVLFLRNIETDETRVGR